MRGWSVAPVSCTTSVGWACPTRSGTSGHRSPRVRRRRFGCIRTTRTGSWRPSPRSRHWRRWPASTTSDSTAPATRAASPPCRSPLRVGCSPWPTATRRGASPVRTGRPWTPTPSPPGCATRSALDTWTVARWTPCCAQPATACVGAGSGRQDSPRGRSRCCDSSPGGCRTRRSPRARHLAQDRPQPRRAHLRQDRRHQPRHGEPLRGPPRPHGLAASARISASSFGRDHIGQWLVGRSIHVTSRSSASPPTQF